MLQANATTITETDPQKLKERLQEAQLELQEYKIKLEKALQVRHHHILFVFVICFASVQERHVANSSRLIILVFLLGKRGA